MFIATSVQLGDHQPVSKPTITIGLSPICLKMTYFFSFATILVHFVHTLCLFISANIVGTDGYANQNTTNDIYVPHLQLRLCYDLST